MAKITYDQQEKMGLVKRPPRGHRSAADLGLTVAEQPARPAKITRIDSPPQQEIGGFNLATHQHQMPPSTKGSHQDRAKAFQIRTKHVSIAAAAASVPIAVVGFAVPLLSAPILLWLFGTYASVWLLSFMLDMAASPDGIGLIRMLYEAGEIRAERKERHKYYRSQYEATK